MTSAIGPLAGLIPVALATDGKITQDAVLATEVSDLFSLLLAEQGLCTTCAETSAGDGESQTPVDDLDDDEESAALPVDLPVFIDSCQQLPQPKPENSEGGPAQAVSQQSSSVLKSEPLATYAPKTDEICAHVPRPAQFQPAASLLNSSEPQSESKQVIAKNVEGSLREEPRFATDGQIPNTPTPEPGTAASSNPSIRAPMPSPMESSIAPQPKPPDGQTYGTPFVDVPSNKQPRTPSILAGSNPTINPFDLGGNKFPSQVTKELRSPQFAVSPNVRVDPRLDGDVIKVLHDRAPLDSSVADINNPTVVGEMRQINAEVEPQVLGEVPIRPESNDENPGNESAEPGISLHASDIRLQRHDSSVHRGIRETPTDQTLNASERLETRLPAAIKIRLDPPDLGKVTVHLRDTGVGGVHVTLEVESIHSRLAVQQSIHQLSSRLAEYGISPSNVTLSMDMSGRQGGGSRQNYDTWQSSRNNADTEPTAIEESGASRLQLVA